MKRATQQEPPDLMPDPLPIEVIKTGPSAGVVVVSLEQRGADGLKPVVVLDADLIDRIDATLDALPRDARGVVLASSAPRAFVAGADLKSIAALNDAELDAYLARGQEVFGRLSQLPCPTAAAIHAAALGGGLELAMHCDGLIGCSTPKPFVIGLPEASLGICPGWGGTNLFPARFHASDALARTGSGSPLKSDEALQNGLFDTWAEDQASLISVAASWVADSSPPPRDGMPSRWIGRPSCRGSVASAVEHMETLSGPQAAVAACVRAGLTDGWLEALAEERRRLIGLRQTDEARAAIEAFFARSKG